MTLYYFIAKVSFTEKPPCPWIIEDREVIVSFRDKTWWVLSEPLIDEGADVQQLYVNWLRQIEHHCVVNEELAPIKVKESQDRNGTKVVKNIGGVGLKFKVFLAISVAAFIFILIVALRPIPTYTEGDKQKSTTPGPALAEDKKTSTEAGQESRSLIVGQYAQVYIDVNSIVPSYMLKNPLGLQKAVIPRSMGSLMEFGYVLSIQDPDTRGLKYALLAVEEKFIPVDNGTTVQIVECVKDDSYRVKVVGGNSNGLEGYLYRQFLR